LSLAKLEAESALARERQYKSRIHKLALYDPLTGIANRNHFTHRFDDALKNADRDGTVVALLVFDLDYFKDVNDSYGHPVGDELLCYVANTLKDTIRETDTVARLGGDEFAIILTKLDKDDRAALIASRVTDLLSKRIELKDCVVKTGTSIGISLYPHDGADQEELLRAADKALYVSKGKGRGQYQFYDADMEVQAREAHQLENDLRLAIVRKEFILNFQPVMSADSKGMICAEALVRWKHPTRGLLMPVDFVEFAEEKGLITDIGKLVLEEACLHCKRWNENTDKQTRVAVNVSPIQFKDKGFYDLVANTLKETGLSPSLLELEITENLMMDNVSAVSAVLKKLTELGVSISVDDFGTGYSSLAYLKSLPIHRLKIDKSFVDNLVHSENDSAIAAAIINMGHSLNLQVVAEGIETALQASHLGQKGCDHLQGYFFSHPLGAEEFDAWMEKQSKVFEYVCH